MKKLLVLLICCFLTMSLFACSEDKDASEKRFNAEDSVELLEEEGLVVDLCFTDADEASGYTTAIFEVFITAGWAFDLEDVSTDVTSAYSLSEQNGQCLILTYRSVNDAKQTEQVLVGMSDSWKIAREGKVIVITNLEIVEELLDLDFQ